MAPGVIPRRTESACKLVLDPHTSACAWPTYAGLSHVTMMLRIAAVASTFVGAGGVARKSPGGGRVLDPSGFRTPALIRSFADNSLSRPEPPTSSRIRSRYDRRSRGMSDVTKGSFLDTGKLLHGLRCSYREYLSIALNAELPVTTNYHRQSERTAVCNGLRVNQ